MAVPVPGSTTAAFVAFVAIGGGCGYWWCDLATWASQRDADSNSIKPEMSKEGKDRAESMARSWSNNAKNNNNKEVPTDDEAAKSSFAQGDSVGVNKLVESLSGPSKNAAGESSIAQRASIANEDASKVDVKEDAPQEKVVHDQHESSSVPRNDVVAGESSIAQGANVANEDASKAQASVDVKDDASQLEVANDLQETKSQHGAKDKQKKSSSVPGNVAGESRIAQGASVANEDASKLQKSADVNNEPQSKRVQPNGENGASASSSLVSMNALFEIGKENWFVRIVGLTLLIDLVALAACCKIGSVCWRRGCSRSSKVDAVNGNEASAEGKSKGSDQKVGQEKNGKQNNNVGQEKNGKKPNRKSGASTGSNSKKKGGHK